MFWRLVLSTFHVYILAPTDKIALVIGNLNYKKKQFDRLSYTMNDALDIASALTELQFKARFLFKHIY